MMDTDAPRQPTTTILVVDDEPQVLELTKKILAKNGYTVLGAARPSEAIEVASQSSTIDLLLTDVGLPQMDVFDMKRRISEKQPEIKTIYMTGSSEETIDAEKEPEMRRHKGNFLLKPFAMQALTLKVEEVLNH